MVFSWGYAAQSCCLCKTVSVTAGTVTCRYLKQKQRWRDYLKLFSFLAFVALYLAVLFLQRNAQVAYQVTLGLRHRGPGTPVAAMRSSLAAAVPAVPLEAVSRFVARTPRQHCKPSAAKGQDQTSHEETCAPTRTKSHNQGCRCAPCHSARDPAAKTVPLGTCSCPPPLSNPQLQSCRLWIC